MFRKYMMWKKYQLWPWQCGAADQPYLDDMNELAAMDSIVEGAAESKRKYDQQIQQRDQKRKQGIPTGDSPLIDTTNTIPESWGNTSAEWGETSYYDDVD